MTDWIKGKISHIKGLSKPSEQHQLLVLLAEKPDKTKQEERKLNALIRAEKANEKAQKAKADLNKIMSAQRTIERKQRDHELYNSAGLLIMADLVDTKTGKPKINTAELLGALLSLKQIPPHDNKRQEWKEHGQKVLDTYKK